MKEFTKAQKTKLRDLMFNLKTAEALVNSFTNYLGREYEVMDDKWELTLEGFRLKEKKDGT